MLMTSWNLSPCLTWIPNTLDLTTVNTIAKNHSKLDYCSALFVSVPQTQQGRVNLFQSVQHELYLKLWYCHSLSIAFMFALV